MLNRAGESCYCRDGSGFLNGLSMLTKGSVAATAVGCVMMLIGVVFASIAAAQMVVLLKVVQEW